MRLFPRITMPWSKKKELTGKLRATLVHHEGVSLKPYRDTVRTAEAPIGKLTIGIGRNLDDNGIRRIEAFFMLENDIEYYIGELDRRLPWFYNLNLDRQVVLASMVFNMGVDAVLDNMHSQGFPKMMSALEAAVKAEANGLPKEAARLYIRAADEMLDSKWRTQVGNRALELADMMRGLTVCDDEES